METIRNISSPTVKPFTVANLRKLEVPNFQRWIVQKNKEELKTSVDEVGILRCPVICRVKDEKKTYIIDGNHLRIIILEDPTLNDKDVFNCIYNEVETFSDAALQFKLLNTKGKHLDWIDITNLYRHIHGDNSVYNNIWSLYLGNPSNPDKVIKHKGFTLPTIIEFLVRDKNKYREGMQNFPDKYIPKKELLSYLLHNATSEWDVKFRDGKRPSGAAILGFSNFWFRNDLHRRFSEAGFLTMVNNIYQDHQTELKSGNLVINRDNAGQYLKEYLQRNYKDIKLK